MRQTFDEARDVVEAPKPGPLMCSAHGCPCQAVSNRGDGWLCRYHDGAEPERWRGITDGLREHQWLRDFLADAQARYGHGENISERVAAFFVTRPELLPDEREAAHWPRWLYRMQGAVARLVGATRVRA